MGSFKGAHFPQDIILMGVRWYVALSIKLSTCRRTDGGARGVDRPRDHPALGREIQSPLGLDFGHSRIDPLQTRQERVGAVGNWMKSGGEVDITKLLRLPSLAIKPLSIAFKKKIFWLDALKPLEPNLSAGCTMTESPSACWQTAAAHARLCL